MAFKSIPVTAAKVTGSHTDFPVLVKPSVITGLGSLTLAQMQSMRVYADLGKTTELAREIVSADEMWVKIPTLSTTTTIYIDYDGVRSDYAVSATYGRNAVWADYEVVLHMESDGTDSTGNGDFTENGSPTYTATNAKIGKGLHFDATDDYLYADRAGIDAIDGSDFTITIWAYYDVVAALTGYLFTKGSQGGSWIGAYTGATFHNFNVDDGSSNTIIAADANTGDAGDQTYFQIVRVAAGDNGYVYTNKDAVNSGTFQTDEDTTVNGLVVGARYTGSAYNSIFDGVISEFRLRLDAMTQNWRDTEYECHNDNGAFWGTAVDVGGTSQNSGFLSIL